MKSPEVYSQLKSELAPWFTSEEFKRAKGLLGWSRPYADAHIVVWCQISQDGWDAYAGSKFVVEFQRSPKPVIGGHNARRARFGFFLRPEEREEVRNIQNSVIAALRCPPANHPALHVSQQVADWYLEKFKPVREPYPEQYDIWLRYASANDVTRWAHFILNKLPRCIDAVEGWANKPMQPTPR